MFVIIEISWKGVLKRCLRLLHGTITKLGNIALNYIVRQQRCLSSILSFSCKFNFFFKNHPSWLLTIKNMMEKSFYHRSVLVFPPLPGVSGACLMACESLFSRKALSPRDCLENSFSQPQTLWTTTDLMLNGSSVLCSLGICARQGLIKKAS